MSSKNPLFIKDEIYHIVLRAVGDTVIFNNKNDFYRGIFSIYEFNNTKPVIIRERRKERIKYKESIKNIVKGLTLDNIEPDKRDKIVEIMAFCFMPNHIHLLLRQLKDNGISQFMQKIGTGYAVYFNKKYSRKGHLFSRFKAIYIEDDRQLQNVFVYIHTNPLFLIEPGWKENGIENSDKAIKFLEEEYRWSSFFDFIGKKNFPSLTTKDFLLQVMGGKDGCRESVRNWIMYKKELKDFGDIILE